MAVTHLNEPNNPHKSKKYNQAKNKMSELGVAKEVEGMRFLVEKIETKTDFVCPVRCYSRTKDYSYCGVQRLFQVKGKEMLYSAIVVTIIATNIGATRIEHVYGNDVLIVDSDGYSHKGTLKCSRSTLPQTEWGDNETEYLPQTKVRFKVLFPTLEEGLSVSKVIIRPYWGRRITLTFNIEDYNDEVSAEFKPLQQDDNTLAKEGSVIHPYGNSYYDIDVIQQRLLALKVSIHSRLTNRLTEREQVNLENKISTNSYALKLVLESRKEPACLTLKKEFDELLSNYKSELSILAETNNDKVDIDTSVNELYLLSPREFEEYTQQLLIRMGYENVILTSYVNDKGIDLFCERNGQNIAVQCKKYKGKVGSPEIISFIGAMSNAHVDSGIFITTGMFTSEAEALAANNPILLIDGVRLEKTITELLDITKLPSKDNHPQTLQTTIDFS